MDSGGSADILGNNITDIRDTLAPPNVSGCQNGVAVLVGRFVDGTTGSARIIGNVIDNYQKNGPTVDNAGSHATFTGTPDVNGVSQSFIVEADDCGEPGTADTFGIKTTTYSNGLNTLIGGNIQIHR